MKVYLAGNTPDREREELVLMEKNLTQRRLISFFFLINNKSVIKMFKLWIK